MIHECKMSGSGRNFIVHPIVKEEIQAGKALYRHPQSHSGLWGGGFES